jgi:DNA repair protein RecN (Recombination protein N)
VLEELRVENLLLIESAQLRLAPGLNVLTGETGAGKTVLAHALDLLLGGRARPGIVRPGASEAYVEGVFELTPALGRELRERLPADAGEVILARRVGADGRTRAYLNGRSATVTELRDVGARLLAFYGQHEHRKLTLSAAQLEILDGTCGPDQGMRLSTCAAAHAETVRLGAELGRLRELSDARERELELLEHELVEIDAAAPAEREHEELLAMRERLRRLDALCAAAGAGADALAPDSHEATGVAQALAGSVMRLEAVASLYLQLDSLADRLRALAIESQDLAGELRDYSGRSEAYQLDRWDPGTDTEAGG